MPKKLINLIGVVVCVGIIALTLALVAWPMVSQSLTTVAATAQVDQTNAIYQAQVDGLRDEEERMDEIETSVAALRTEIPASNELDAVFELVAGAAVVSGVEVQTITAGEPAGFTERTAALPLGETVETDAPAETTETTDAATDAAADAQAPVEPVVPVSGRTQVDFTITVTAVELSQVVGFLDQLRTGPRLLGNVQSTVTPTGSGFTVSVVGLTYILEG